jgi:hypothetical protein
MRGPLTSIAKHPPPSISLAFRAGWSDPCVNGGNHRQGENLMTSITEQTSTPAPATAETKATTKPRVSARRPHVATPKPKPGKKATSAKKTPTSRTKAQVPRPEARSGSKTAKILDLLRRPGGASARELLKATGWQPHSLRGFLSGTVGRKMGLALTSTKGEDGERVYSLKT